MKFYLDISNNGTDNIVFGSGTATYPTTGGFAFEGFDEVTGITNTQNNSFPSDTPDAYGGLAAASGTAVTLSSGGGIGGTTTADRFIVNSTGNDLEFTNGQVNFDFVFTNTNADDTEVSMEIRRVASSGSTANLASFDIDNIAIPGGATNMAMSFSRAISTTLEADQAFRIYLNHRDGTQSGLTYTLDAIRFSQTSTEFNRQAAGVTTSLPAGQRHQFISEIKTPYIVNDINSLTITPDLPLAELPAIFGAVQGTADVNELEVHSVLGPKLGRTNRKVMVGVSNTHASEAAVITNSITSNTTSIPAGETVQFIGDFIDDSTIQVLETNTLVFDGDTQYRIADDTLLAINLEHTSGGTLEINGIITGKL